MTSLLEAYNTLINDPDSCFLYSLKGDIKRVDKEPIVIEHLFPGNFNPLHDGHRSVYNSPHLYSNKNFYFVTSIKKQGGIYISLNNLDKCLSQFKGNYNILITNTCDIVDTLSVVTYTYYYNKINIYLGYEEAIELIKKYKRILKTINCSFYLIPTKNKLSTDLPKNYRLLFKDMYYINKAYINVSGEALRQEGKGIY